MAESDVAAGRGTPETAKLILEGKEYTLPVVRGTEGEKAVDISSLRKTTGFVTLDKGYENTGSCRSAITFIDGEKGILRYRGYPIEELAAKSTFTEVAYLLLYGELPTTTQLEEFSTFLNESSLIHEDMLHFFVGFPRGSHPMGILATTVASLSTFYPIPEVMDEKAERQILANLISQVRTIAAISYKKSIGEPIVYPSYKLRYVPNFLNMMFSSPVKEHEARRRHRAGHRPVPHPARGPRAELQHLHRAHRPAPALPTCTRSSPPASPPCGGPRHGGANQEVIAMLERIRAEHGDGTEYVRRAKDRNTPDRLMGFGHRVYKSFDPRAKILKEACHTLLAKPGMNDPLFDIALRLEEIALKDEYFLSRNLYPNVDFYSGLILRAAGIPYDMFTVLFAIGRTAGLAGALAGDVPRGGLPHHAPAADLRRQHLPPLRGTSQSGHRRDGHDRR